MKKDKGNDNQTNPMNLLLLNSVLQGGNIDPNMLQAMQGLQGLATTGALGALNPVEEVMNSINRPTRNLLLMLFGDAIHRGKLGIQTRNLIAQEEHLKQRADTVKAATNQVNAMEELALSFLRSGSLNDMQRAILTMQYPQLAEQVQREKEEEKLDHELSLTKKKAELESINHDPKDHFVKELAREADEMLLRLQTNMDTSEKLAQAAKGIKDKIQSSNYSDAERKFLLDRLTNLLAQLHMDTHGNDQ